MRPMIFQQIVNEDAGCISYLIACSQAGQALVVDPARDRVDDYAAWARRKGLELTHIADTHVHADHISGNQSLAAKAGARVHIHPAHGGGSSCGRAMSSKPGSTIGFERRFNPALQPRKVEDFVRELMTGLPPKPPSFDRIIARNRAQALPSMGELQPLSAAQAREAIAKGGIILDVRSPAEFGEGHVPGAINVWIESSPFAPRVAMMAPVDSRFILVAAGPSDLQRSVEALGRAGMDDILGYLQRGMTDWRREGLPHASVPQITVHDLATMREERADLVVVDVREVAEWVDGHIAGAVNVPMSQALSRMGELPADRPKAVLCAGGLRSSSVISALRRAGLTDCYNVAGGMREWVKAGYSTVKPRGIANEA